MKLYTFSFEEIYVEEDRQRTNIPVNELLELAGSIAQVGLIHPIVVRKDDEGRIVLVAGERRLRAMEYVWNFGNSIRIGEYNVPPQMVPCVFQGEIDPITAYEIELEENAQRAALPWQDQAKATARLARMKEAATGEPPTPVELAEDLGKSVAETGGGGQAATSVRLDLILARNLTDPDVAKAPTKQEAFKILKRKEEVARNAELGRQVVETLAASHRLLRGNCLEILPNLPDSSFDIILTDPPYGMSAQDFGDSGGTGGAVGGHFYEDSPEHFVENMPKWIATIKRVCKPQCHVYWFCDIDWFHELKGMWLDSEWKVFRTPLIWFNPGGSRAPWPQQGPQRKSQYILFAVRGNRPVTALYGDVITCGSDSNLNHHAQKPVALYGDLLRRSVRPGDSVLDPFCGTGTVFPAAHAAKCKATGIEIDEAACGIAAKRLEVLK